MSIKAHQSPSHCYLFSQSHYVLVLQFSSWSDQAFSKAKMSQSFAIKINIDCQGCHNKVRKALLDIEGLQGFQIDESQNKVTVTGTIDQEKFVKKLARKTHKHIELVEEKKKKDKDNSNGKPTDSKPKSTKPPSEIHQLPPNVEQPPPHLYFPSNYLTFPLQHPNWPQGYHNCNCVVYEYSQPQPPSCSIM